MVFINKSKIHFESKSQLLKDKCEICKGCLSINQRYILKANHNGERSANYYFTGVYQ